MEYVLIQLVTFAASGLVLFSGFGLGTMLVPVFAICFPLDVAVAMTITGRDADYAACLRELAQAVANGCRSSWPGGWRGNCQAAPPPAAVV